MKDRTVIQKLVAKIQNVLSIIKNEFNETLADGTAIRVMSDDEDWTGKQVVYEDGTPLPAGDYTLATGKVLVVGDNYTIAEVREAAPENKPEENQESPEDMKKIEELTAKLAEMTAAKEAAEAALGTQQAQTQAATAKAAKFENRVKQVETDLIALKEEVSKTIGDTTPPGKGNKPLKQMVNQQEEYDPMGEEALKFYKNRNIIRNED